MGPVEREIHDSISAALSETAIALEAHVLGVDAVIATYGALIPDDPGTQFTFQLVTALTGSTLRLAHEVDELRSAVESLQ